METLLNRVWNRKINRLQVDLSMHLINCLFLWKKKPETWRATVQRHRAKENKSCIYTCISDIMQQGNVLWMVLIYNCKIVLRVGSVGLTCETFIETQARSTQVGAVGRIVPPVGGGGLFFLGLICAIWCI